MPPPAKGTRNSSVPSEVIFAHSPRAANTPLKEAQPTASTTPHHTAIQPMAKMPCTPSCPGSSRAPAMRHRTEIKSPTANQPKLRRKAVPSNSPLSAEMRALRAAPTRAWFACFNSVAPEGSAE